MRKKWQRGYKGCHPPDGQLMSFLPFLFVFLFFFFPRGLFVCAQPVPVESFCLNDYNKIMRLICKGGTLWIFQKSEIHWRWPTLTVIKGQTLDVFEYRKYKTLYQPLLSCARLWWILFMNVIMYLSLLFENIFIYLAQFNLIFAWWCLTTFASKKNPCTLSTNSTYYYHERAKHQIYQFHLEGVVLASEFVSKSGRFEDKHSIVTICKPPPFSFLPFSSLTTPYFKAKRLRWKFEKKWKTNCSFVSGRRPDTWANFVCIFSLHELQ